MICKTTLLAIIAALALPATVLAHADDGYPRDDPRAGGRDAPLSMADAVTPVVLAAGETTLLRLPTNPSTGYGWQVVETLNLKVDEPFAIERDPATPDDRVGAPETAVIHLTPRGRGPASLTLVYKRPWADASPDDQRLHFVFIVE